MDREDAAYTLKSCPCTSHLFPTMKWGVQKNVPVRRLIVSVRNPLHQSGESPWGRYSTFSMVRRQADSHQPCNCPCIFCVKQFPRCECPEVPDPYRSRLAFAAPWPVFTPWIKWKVPYSVSTAL